MSNIKISELPEASSVGNNDLLIVVSSGSPYVTKKITWNNLNNDLVPEALSNNSTYGRKNGQWVDIYGNANLQFTQGTASEVLSYTPLSGEPVYDSTNKVVYIGDGSTVRGNLIGNISKFVKTDNTVMLTAGGSYITPLSVTLNSLNSIWEITTFMSFLSADGDNETYVDVFPTISNISMISVDVISSIDNGNSLFTDAYATPIIFNTMLGYRYGLKARNIVQLTGASAAFGIKCREVSGFDAYLESINIVATRIS